MFISQTTDFHFANYRFSFRKLQIFISQTTDSHFANYRFSFRKLQILISQTTDFHFANYRFPFRKLQILISQTKDFHFANYRFPFRFVPFRFANYSKPVFISNTPKKPCYFSFIPQGKEISHFTLLASFLHVSISNLA